MHLVRTCSGSPPHRRNSFARAASISKRDKQSAGCAKGLTGEPALPEKNAAVRAATVPASRNGSVKPSRASVSCPRPLMNSPQTRCRG